MADGGEALQRHARFALADLLRDLVCLLMAEKESLLLKRAGRGLTRNGVYCWTGGRCSMELRYGHILEARCCHVGVPVSGLAKLGC